MSIEQIIDARNIVEIVHFTTNRGLVGILDSGFIKTRENLPKDDRLEYILHLNAEDRAKDANWLGYVNLSISRINQMFFASSTRWHKTRDLWWIILAFDPVILTHDDVWFATTNNIYTGVRRKKGTDGLEALFASKVIRWSGNVVERAPDLPKNFTTCVQAEVLYPHQLSTEYLRRIYVSSDDHGDEIQGPFEALRHRSVEIVVDADKFRGQ